MLHMLYTASLTHLFQRLRAEPLHLRRRLGLLAGRVALVREGGVIERIELHRVLLQREKRWAHSVS